MTNINAEKNVIEKKASDFWMKFRHYIVGGAALIVVIVGLVFLGQWYASGKAKELTEALHNQFRQENQGLYDNIAVNANKIVELKQITSTQSVAIAKLKRTREGGIINVINTKDPKQLSSLYDNLVDSYSKPADFGK